MKLKKRYENTRNGIILIKNIGEDVFVFVPKA